MKCHLAITADSGSCSGGTQKQRHRVERLKDRGSVIEPQTLRRRTSSFWVLLLTPSKNRKHSPKKRAFLSRYFRIPIVL